MRENLDVITLRGLSAVGHHGVYDFERSGSQVFSADLTLYVDARQAALTDDVKYTVDYSQIAEDAVKILTGTPVYLLETLAQRLVDAALAYTQVQAVEVTVHKPMAPVRHQFSDVSVTLRRDRTEDAPEPEVSRVVLALGSNMGDSTGILRNAVSALIEVPGLELDEVSSLYRTRPVLEPGMASQNDYENAVVLARTVLTPHELLKTLQDIENRCGRRRTERWGARTLDIDIVDFGGRTLTTSDLTLPHPRAGERAFVLVPWSEVDPQARLTDGRGVATAAAMAPDRQGITDTIADWLSEEQPSQAMPQPQSEESPQSVPELPKRSRRSRRDDRKDSPVQESPSRQQASAEPQQGQPVAVRAEPVPQWEPRENVRIVDSDDPEDATVQPRPLGSRVARRAVIRPTPTGSISLPRGTQSDSGSQ